MPRSDQRPDQRPDQAQRAGQAQGLRIIALTAVVAGVLFLAAALFVLSYQGIHAVARQAGVPALLARIYPLIFDAMLVISASAVLALRGAGLLTRAYAWLSLLLLMAAAAAGDVAHATSVRIAHSAAAAGAAVVPWVLVLTGFGLLLAMLRHARIRRAGADEKQHGTAAPAPGTAIAHRGEARAHYRAALPQPGTVTQAGLAIDADAGQDDPTSDEASASWPAGGWAGRPAGRPAAPPGYSAGKPLAGELSAAPVPELVAGPPAAPGSGAQPFDRPRSSPVPPGSAS